jgi:hypothetical protein
MACSRPRSPLTDAPAVVRNRRSKTSKLLERRRENCSGVRTGAEAVLVLGSYEGKMVMCSGLFCLKPLVSQVLLVDEDPEAHITPYYP